MSKKTYVMLSLSALFASSCIEFNEPSEFPASADRWVAVSAGGDHACGIFRRAGEDHLYCWGSNANGQIALPPSQKMGDRPIRAFSVGTRPDLQNLRWLSISAGNQYACGVTVGNLGRCWGKNDFGQAGGTGLEAAFFSQMETSTNFTYSIARHASGAGGALYFHGSADRNRPNPNLTQVEAGNLWLDVAVGVNRICAIRKDSGSQKSLWCGAPGSLNLARVDQQNWVSIESGETHVCALGEHDINCCFGNNLAGQIGDGTRTPRDVPTLLAIPFDQFKWHMVSAGLNHSCGILKASDATDRTLYCWGDNAFGQLGADLQGSRLFPEPLGSSYRDWQWDTISTGNEFTCGVRTDGALYCWGKGVDGRLGVGSDVDKREPTLVAAPST